MLFRQAEENTAIELPPKNMDLEPRLKSIYYPAKRYGQGFEGHTSRLEEYVDEVKETE